MERWLLHQLSQEGAKGGEGAGTGDQAGQTDNTKGVYLTKLTESDIKKLIETNQTLKSEMQKEADRVFSKGLKTWKQNNLEKIINEEIEKRAKENNPQETEEQKNIRAMREEINSLKLKYTIAENQAKALKIATEKKIPDSFLDVLDYSNTEKMDKQLDSIDATWTKALEARIEEEVAKRTGRPSPTKTSDSMKNPYETNPWETKTRSVTMQAKIEMENPELAAFLKKQAGTT